MTAALCGENAPPPVAIKEKPVSLRRVIFATRADRSLGKSSVLALFGQATIAHRRHRLQGVLAFTGTHFFQVIEGAAADIATVLGLVQADRRNRELRVLCDAPVGTHRFAGWTTVCVASPALALSIAGAHAEPPGCSGAAALVDGLVADAGLNALDPTARRCATLGACGEMLDLLTAPGRRVESTRPAAPLPQTPAAR
jgi:hypothetical protein